MVSLEPRQAAMIAQVLRACLRRVQGRALGDVEGHPFHGNQWTTGSGSVYHGTAKERVDSILKDGLRASRAGLVHPTLSDKDHVYVTNDLVAARHWAAATKAQSVAVLEIHLPRDVRSRLTADTLAGNRPINFKFKGDIKPEWIKGVSTLTFGKGEGWIKTLAQAEDVYFVPVIIDHKLRSAARNKETPVHAAADAHLKPMTLAAWYAIASARKAYKAGGTDAAIKAMRAALLKAMPKVLNDTLVAGGQAALGQLKFRTAKRPPLTKRVGRITIRFDAKNERAAAWAKKHATELIDEMTKTTRDRIKAAVARSFETGEAAYDAVLDAIGDEARAQVIARTETMIAANEGQRQAWDQAVEKSLLPDDATVSWIATEVDPCPQCEALDGETRTMDGTYEGGILPIAHPNCRCTEGITGY